MTPRALSGVVGAFVLALTVSAAGAAGQKVGLSISIDGDGFFLNPVIKKVTVTKVVGESLASSAGIVVGDEVLQVDGHPIVGQRGLDLKPYLDFPAGKTRHLHLRHPAGAEYDAYITKPKE